jgi:photosystem II stability/assembly factor-like uncharacterized protein
LPLIFYAVGGNLYKTSDYGVTSTFLKTFPNNVYSICYTERGILLVSTNSDSYVYRSTDYGITWGSGVRPTTGSFYLGTLTYLGNGIILYGGVTSGSRPDLRKSSDFGLTWSAQKWTDGTWNNIYAIINIGNGIAVMLGNDYGPYRTTNWGENWGIVAEPTFAGGGARSGTSITDGTANGVVLVGSGYQQIYRSTDYGLTFTSVATINFFAVQSIIYLRDGICFACGEGYRTGRSTDWGATWDNVNYRVNSKIPKALAYPNKNSLFLVCGHNSGFSTSTDGGANWSLGADVGSILAMDTVSEEGSGSSIGSVNSMEVG